MFRFNEDKQQVEAVLRSRQAYLSSQTIFKATDDGYYHASTAILPGERARGRGAFRGRGRGFGGRSVRSVCSPSNSARPLLEASAASTPKVVEMDNSIFAEEFPTIAAAGTDGDTSGGLEGSSRIDVGEVTTDSPLSNRSLQSVLTHRGGSPSRDMCGDRIDATTATTLVRVDGTSSKVTMSNSPSVADMSSLTESRTAASTMATMTTQPSESSVEVGEVKKPSSAKKKFRKFVKFLRSYSSSISGRRRRQQKSGCKETLSANDIAPPFNATNAATATANRPHYILQNPLLSRRSGSMMIYQQKRESLHNAPLPYDNSILEDPAINIMIDPVVDQIDITIDPVDQIDIMKDPVDQIDIMKDPVDQINIMKDPVVDQIDIMKDPVVDQINIMKDPVDQINIMKDPVVDQIDIMKDPDVDQIDIMKDPDVDQIYIIKDPVVDQIDIAIDPVVDQINTMVDPVDQIDTMVDPEMGLGMDVSSSTGLQASEGLQSYALNDIKQDGAYDPSIEQPGIEMSDPTMIGFPEKAREGAIEGERVWDAVASMEGPLVTLQHEDPLVTLQHEDPLVTLQHKVSLVCISDPKSDTGKVTDIIDGLEAQHIIICEVRLETMLCE